MMMPTMCFKIHLSRFFRGIDNFKQDSKLYSWMYRIATNESITFINKRARERNTDISEIQNERIASLSSDEWYTGDEIQLILQKAIATLPQKTTIGF